jgi:Zn-dependent metalloprotease
MPAAGSPSSFEMATGTHIREEEFFSRYKDVFGLGPHDRMVAIRSGTDISQHTYTRFQQHHREIPVIGAEIILTHTAGSVASGVGALVPNLNVPLTIALSPDAARDRALDAIAREMSRRQTDVQLLKPSRVQLVILPSRVSAEPLHHRLVYRCTVFSASPMEGRIVDVDAASGRVVEIIVPVSYAWATQSASGTSIYNGPVTFLAQTDIVQSSGNVSRLHETLEHPLETRDLQNVDTDPAKAVEVNGQDGVFDDSLARVWGASVHWAAERALDYFRQAFQRAGWKGDGATPLLIYVRLPEMANIKRSAWLSDREIIVIPYVSPPLISLDIIAHEVTHAVAHATCGLISKGESGALLESFCDIFATMVEFAALPATGNWRIGEDPFAPGQLRRLDKPKSIGALSGKEQPDTYLGMNWIYPGELAEDELVHLNDGVPNFWFYLLSEEAGEGTNDLGYQYHVVPIGREKAARIAYLNMTGKLASNALFADAREGARSAAIYLYGEYSQAHLSTEEAWYAVGVGKPLEPPHYLPTPDKPVEPWPTKFEWSIGLNETAWEIQVHTKPNFPMDIDMHTTTTPDTTVASGETVGAAQFTLKPDTTYYWRIRQAPPPPTSDGWRPVLTFTTDAKRPAPISPSTGMLRNTYHPWQLTFSWTKVNAATSYDIEIGTEETFNPWKLLLKPKNVAATQDDIQHTVLDVSIKATLWWRVRANGPGNDPANVGQWSFVNKLQTSKVTVEIVTPKGGADVYPWPVHLEWTAVIGAAKYIVETERRKDQYGPESLVKPLEFTSSPDGTGPPTSVDLNLRPRRTTDQEVHVWRVRVIGPDINAPEPFHEEGDPSNDESFVNAGDATEVQVLSPVGWCDPDPALAPLFSWPRVVEAKKYHLTIRRYPEGPAVGPVESPDFGWPADPVHFEDDLPADEGTDVDFRKQIDLPAEVGVVGYRWTVVAIGPEGLPGLTRPYLVHITFMPDRPDVIYPAMADHVDPTLDVLYEPSPVIFTFRSTYTPSGRYLLEAFEGYECGTLIESQVCKGNPGGVTEVPIVNLKPDTPYSWRQRAWSANLLVDDSYPWSTCWAFRTKSEPEPPEPPPPLPTPDAVNTGGIEIAVVAFTKVAGATKYQIEAYHVNSADPNQILDTLPLQDYDDDDLSQFMSQMEPVIGQLPPPWVVAPLYPADPSSCYAMVVRANKGTNYSQASQLVYWDQQHISWPF